MKKLILGLTFLSIFGNSCKTEEVPTPPVSTPKYMSLTAVSTWNYEVVNNLTLSTSQYTLTSTNRDSAINGKAYHVFTNSSGSANEYYNITGSEYYNFRSLPAALGGNSVENLYLTDNLNATPWSKAYPVTVNGISTNVTVTNSITGKGLSKVVNNFTYTNVIQVTTTLAVLGVPSSALITDIQAFYAPKYGLIQSINKINLNFMTIVSNTDQETKLKTADIK